MLEREQQEAERIARGAGAILMKYFGTELQVKTKQSENDFVTNVDLEVNAYLMGELRRLFPKHGIVSEEIPEASWELDKEFVWTIDPLDGTKCFMAGFPAFGTMLALLHNGDPVLGVVYLPVTDELVVGVKGQGATVNGTRLQCSGRETLKESFGSFCTHFSYFNRSDESVARTQAFHDAMVRTPFYGMTFWAIAPHILLAARGEVDWMAMTGDIWDFMPGVIILQEAGCVVTNWTGTDLPRRTEGIVAGNPTLHQQILDILN